MGYYTYPTCLDDFNIVYHSYADHITFDISFRPTELVNPVSTLNSGINRLSVLSLNIRISSILTSIFVCYYVVKVRRTVLPQTQLRWGVLMLLEMWGCTQTISYGLDLMFMLWQEGFLCSSNDICLLLSNLQETQHFLRKAIVLSVYV